MIKIAICRKDVYGAALSVLLEKADGLTVAGVFVNPITALEALNVVPDVLLIDLASSQSATSQQIQKIKEKHSAIKILVLTDNDDTDNIIGCVRAGIDGYLLRTSSLLMLRDSIIEAYKGGFPMSPPIARKLLQTFTASTQLQTISESLTDREMEVLQQLVDGMSYKLISANLGIAINTVRSHIKKLYEKMEVNSKSEAVSKALRQRLVQFG